MNSRLQKILCEAKYEISAELKESICCGVQKRTQRENQIKTWFFSFLGLSSLVIFVPVIKLLISDLSSSGLTTYLSLIYTDFNLIFSHTQEFVLIVAESLPIISMTLCIAILFLFILSIKKLTEQSARNGLVLSV